MKNHRMFVYLLLLVYLITSNLPYKATTIDPVFVNYYTEFETIVKQYCTEDQYFHPNCKIEFHEFVKNEIGMCLGKPNKYTIWIKKKYWDEGSDNEKFSLLIHELSHCELDLDHDPDPNNYMYFDDRIVNSKEIVIEQLKTYLKKKCGGKK